MKNQMTTEEEVIDAFWEAHPELEERDTRHNGQTATARTAFSFYVDSLARDGVISEELASSVTLG